jgi:hypothetical protein
MGLTKYIKHLFKMTLFNYFKLMSAEGVVDFKFEDLLIFLTGADCLPPPGFSDRCSINFYDQEPGVKRIPFASTCSLSLFLPRGMECETEFRDLMCLALRGSLGFGKM